MKQCMEDIFPHLDSGKELFSTFFPGAEIAINHHRGRQKVEAQDVLEYKIHELKQWIHQVLEQAIQVSVAPEKEIIAPKSIQMPFSMAEKLIQTILKIFTCGRDIADHDYYFLADVTGALTMEGGIVLKIIDQTQYEIRKSFFSILLEYLDEQQCFHCAILLYQAIRADKQIHPAEFKYIENISQLLRNDQAKLEQVEATCRDEFFLPPIQLNEELSIYLFRYLIEIVMCDEDYNPQESEFVRRVALLFDFDKQRQDEVIQPVAATQMVKASLFPKN